MDESASQTPPSHSTSFLSFATLGLSFSLLLFFFHHPHICHPVFSPFLTLAPVSLSLLCRMGIIFLEIQKEKEIWQGGDQGAPPTAENLQRIQRWPQFSAHFLHFLLLFLPWEELQRAVGEAWGRSPGEHQRTSRTSTQAETVPRVRGTTETQFEGTILLQSVTLFTPHCLDVPKLWLLWQSQDRKHWIYLIYLQSLA